MNLQMFFWGACACTVLLCSKKKKKKKREKSRTKKEGAEALEDCGSVSLHCGQKGGDKGLFATPLLHLRSVALLKLPHKKLHTIRIVQRMHRDLDLVLNIQYFQRAVI